MPSNSGSSTEQIVGYKYFMAVHMGIGRGPINELVEIRVGDDLTAWMGPLATSDFFSINAPNLFGGDQKEGGLVGTAKLYMGEATQVVDSFVTDQIEGGPVPGWRGVATVFYYGQIAANNPYPKPWKLRARRTTAGWDNDNPWYPERARIVTGYQAIYHFNLTPLPGDTITLNGGTMTFVSDSPGEGQVLIGPDVNHAADNLATAINADLDRFPGALGAVTDTQNGARRCIVGTETTPSISSSSGSPARIETFFGDGIAGMNPAHIIYECATNNIWGRGLSPSLIDENSFITAADQLVEEQFGLCLRWNRQDDIDKFIATVVQHIGAALYFDRQTGLLTLTLIRDDYDPEELPILTFENGILEITEDQSSSSDTSYNEIIVKFIDPTINKAGQVRVQNLASFQSIGTLISTTVEYLGCPTATLAARLAQRDLQMNSSDIRRMTIKMDRTGWTIPPGGVFRISVPSRGIGNMILRAGNIEDSPLQDGTITIHAVQDVFGLPAASFVTPQRRSTAPADRSPWVIYDRMVGEMTYFDASAYLTSTDLAVLTPEMGVLKVYAAQPKSNTIEYSLMTKAEGETAFAERSRAGFEATALLATALSLHGTAITFNNSQSMGAVTTGQLAMIGEEYIHIAAINLVAGTATITRGCVDTIPVPHAIGERIWWQTAVPTTDFREYASSESVEVQLLSRTTSELLDPSLAQTDTVEIEGRQGRPYPGVNLKINSVPFELTQAVTTGTDVVFTWAHRDRLTQANFLLGYNDPSTGPEAGTTYTWRVYNGATLLRTVAGIPDATWTYTAAMAAADGGLTAYRFEFESERGGLTSWQTHSFAISFGA